MANLILPAGDAIPTLGLLVIALLAGMLFLKRWTAPGAALRAAGPLAIMAAAALLSAPASAQECETCHDTAAPKLAKSAHAAVKCAQCHPKREAYPHAAGAPKSVGCGACHAPQTEGHAASVHGRELRKGNAGAPGCDSCHGAAHELVAARTADFRKTVPETCGMCHAEVLGEFNKSVHGAAVAKQVVNAPVCTDCHGEHAILRPSEAGSMVNAGHIRDTCARCHANLVLARQFGLPPDRVMTFDASFHGLAEKGGVQTVANCASCHGFHTILPSTDPKSMTHGKNLAATCGKCHPGAGERFALGPVHVAEGSKTEAPIVRLVRSFYLVLIPLTLGFMLLHHGGDFLRKLIALRGRGATGAVPHPVAAPGAASFRMYPLERVLHGLLAVSFLVLVWSGFALKYSAEWWAVGGSLRGVVHRGAGVVMIAVSVAHAVMLLADRRARAHWKTLLPRWRDFGQAWRRTLYNAGLRNEKPPISAHSYIEKIEYWAVVWGTLVMAVSGILLWANNWVLANLPKVVLDLANTVHFYEAILAAAAILIWHFYSVIFDPDVYPMDTAWWSGHSPRRHDDDHPAGEHEA